MTKIYVGENIRNFRERSGMTQAQFAEIFGVTAQAVSKWEQNKNYPDIVLLPEIARFIGVSVGQFFGEK